MPVETSQHSKELIPISFLQSGNDLIITKNVSFKHPIIQEVIDIDKISFGLHSEDIYYSYINLFLTDPYTYMVYLDDKGLDYEKVTSFELFCMLFEDYNSRFREVFMNEDAEYTEEQINKVLENHIYFKAFKFFFGIDNFFIAHNEDQEKVLAYNGNTFLLDAEIFDYVNEFIRKMNGIPDIEKIYPDDEWAKQILIEDERERLKKQMKKNSDDDKNNNRLGNLLSSVTWSCNGGITPFNRNQLHMYDLIDGIHRTDKLLNYKNTMVGFYSGCVDKTKINFTELHWSTD